MHARASFLSDDPVTMFLSLVALSARLLFLLPRLLLTDIQSRVAELASSSRVIVAPLAAPLPASGLPPCFWAINLNPVQWPGQSKRQKLSARWVLVLVPDRGRQACFRVCWCGTVDNASLTPHPLSKHASLHNRQAKQGLGRDGVFSFRLKICHPLENTPMY